MSVRRYRGTLSGFSEDLPHALGGWPDRRPSLRRQVRPTEGVLVSESALEALGGGAAPAAHLTSADLSHALGRAPGRVGRQGDGIEARGEREAEAVGERQA